MLNINKNITHYKTFENEIELRIKEINDLNKKRNCILQQKIKNNINKHEIEINNLNENCDKRIKKIESKLKDEYDKRYTIKLQE